jgi:enoyl-CoA hydratase
MSFFFEKTSDVKASFVDGILLVRIHRPEKRNPLSLGVLDEIRCIFTKFAAEQTLRLAIITGAGEKAFASGGDLNELAQFKTAEDAEAFSWHGKSALDAIRFFPVPVIAKLNGVALGGGAELALACDMRIAAASAKIGFIHGRLNIAPSWGGGIDLIRLIGPAKAIAMMTRAEVFDAPSAMTLGIIDACAGSDDSFDAMFDTFIAPMRERPPQVMRAIKSLAIVDSKPGRYDADREETSQFSSVWSHEDHWSAVAMLEKKRS